MKSKQIYYGWWIVAASAIGMSTGPGQFAFGSLALFIKPLSQEFGWLRAEISLAASLFTIALAISIPFIGQLVDKYGSRIILLPSIICCASLMSDWISVASIADQS